MIFQEPMASFAPAIKIGKQMVEQLLIHKNIDIELHLLGRKLQHFPSLETPSKDEKNDVTEKWLKTAFYFFLGVKYLQRATQKFHVLTL